MTRDRTFCVGQSNSSEIAAPQPLPEEKATSDEIATVLMTPYEVVLNAGESAEFTLKAYDGNGNFIKEFSSTEMPSEGLALGDELSGLIVEGNKISVPANWNKSIGGNFTAKVGDLVATGRVRAFNSDSSWSWNFDDYKPMQVPPTWIRAFAKLKPTKVPGTENIAMLSGGLKAVRGRPSHVVWMGPPEMSNYTVQADVLMKEQNRRIGSVGISANRYSFIIKGNNSKLAMVTWAAHLRLGAVQRFVPDPDTWYTMKMTVEYNEEDRSAKVMGKVWPRDEQEPAEWTMEVTDPRGNKNGSPGLYMYSLADSYFDNIIVTDNSEEAASADK